MKKAKQDGGPAFPVGAETRLDEEGMSLRDWFAGQALPGVAAKLQEHATDALAAKTAARIAYMIADAMLAARKETP